jgi:uncharacterized membrane protein YcaP (DUF421 family)
MAVADPSIVDMVVGVLRGVVGQVFFDDWAVLVRTAMVGILAYAMLILFLRLSGKRTLSKMNAFDLVVTVALGSTLATILLNREVTLAEGLLALALLIGLQLLITWSSMRARWVRKLVTGEPTLLLYRGVMLPDALRKARVAEDEVRAAVRSAGVASLERIEAVVLETDGSFSVVEHAAELPTTSLKGVRLPDRARIRGNG